MQIYKIWIYSRHFLSAENQKDTPASSTDVRMICLYLSRSSLLGRSLSAGVIRGTAKHREKQQQKKTAHKLMSDGIDTDHWNKQARAGLHLTIDMNLCRDICKTEFSMTIINWIIKRPWLLLCFFLLLLLFYHIVVGFAIFGKWFLRFVLSMRGCCTQTHITSVGWSSCFVGLK